MIILFPQGRLGNQIFQYQFARSQLIDRHEKILTSRHNEYRAIFDDDVRYWRWPNYKNYSYLVFKFLASIGIISSIVAERAEHFVETGSFVRKKGLISQLKFIDGFFQSDRYVCRESLNIKAHLQAAARKTLDSLSPHRKVFVHLRRGDYLMATVFGKKDCTLPIEFYEKAMARFTAEKKVVFVVISDEKEYAESTFGHSKNTVLMPVGDTAHDFALMSLCDGAIISASSFSWWGAYLMKDTAQVIAPKYWMGFKSKQWWPRGIDTTRFYFLEI